jgi:hypothetical protein
MNGQLKMSTFPLPLNNNFYMRNLLFFIGVISFLSACDSSDSQKENQVKAPSLVDTSTQIISQLPMPTGLSFKKFTLKAENCSGGPLDDEMEIDEDWCNTREINGLKVSMTDTEVAQKINFLIEKEITGAGGRKKISLKKFIDEIKNSSNESGEMEYMQDSYTCRLADSSNTYLSIYIFSEHYGFGAAHGYHGSSVLNIDLKTGNQIKLKDVLVDNYKSALKSLAKRKFLAQNGNEGWWFLEDDKPFELPDVFSITRKGITFTYQLYEIGSYVVGAPEIFLSIKDLGS